MFAIETQNLTKRFGKTVVVDGLSLQVPTGCVFGFLGPNGAGKTTTLRLLLGLLRPDRGCVHLLGHNLFAHRLQALSGVGAFVESASVYDHLSGRANLELTRRVLGLREREIDRVLELVELQRAGNKRVRDYSLGMKQRLALARALLGKPRLLLLDEPTNGLDPDGIMAMRRLIRELPDRIGGTVFVSSHLLSEVEQTAQGLCLLRAGSAVLQGSVADLLDRSSQIDFTVDRAGAAMEVLIANGVPASLVDEGAIRVQCPGEDRAAAAAANRLLVTHGIAVSAMTPRKRSLEDLYRDTLRAEDGAARQGPKRRAA
ncbi:ATP-binding cassette domain-containing protein [Erythrobacter sp. 3-20A1M]|uniref:ATP-binding cassette domain-containing protein n=1 Tax=Erythrobacter sp. 3-20A1M TaxID=2653850 RepID=UPI001BFCCE4D|nr:ATP-binding cassette domain-containing protein [Erythrobacter sp. 3-20A1M]QWC55733.1 ATP-binding cassette domain-containing protein [Erythrobacter sp. 3-20A1M]